MPQSYDNAFALYFELAVAGDANAMYFVGKCFRNGYAVEADAGKAQQWFIKAANAGEKQATHELNYEPLPDNALIYNPGLKSQITSLRSYAENVNTVTTDNISGSYSGFAVYYDFSRQFILEVSKLTLSIQKNNEGYTGTWKENDTLEAPIKATFSSNSLDFNNSTKYTRYNHYSNRTPEPYLFNNASLNIKYVNDSMYLTGEVQFYSIVRKEPGEPMFIILGKKIVNADGEENLELQVTPNPATSQIVVHFNVNNTSRVSFEILDISGKTLQKTSEETLPEGAYSYPLNVDNLPKGTYVLRAINGNKSQSKLFVKL